VTKKCYDELGCLVTNKVWYHPENRPENPEPANRHTVKTQFIYYTRNQTSKHITEGVMSIAHFNVFSVDWEFGARPPYAQAASNARVVALEVIFLLKCLQASVLTLIYIKIHIIVLMSDFKISL
ncbi:hypothetical protein C0J52_03009, partial [Blattella germanica]